MNNLLLLLAVSLICACGQHKHEHRGEGDHHHHHHKEAHNLGHSHHHGDANTHMHQRPVSELIERFESPERDAYQQPEKVIKFLGDIQGKKVIDIGAGSGYFSVKLAAAGAQVIAADVNEEFQAHVTTRIKEMALQNIEPRLIPYDSPGLTNQEVDILFMVNTYHHIEDRVDYFKKAKEGLKADGRVVIIDFFKHDLPVGPPTDHKISIDDVLAELKKSGYSRFDVEVNLLEYQYIVTAN